LNPDPSYHARGHDALLAHRRYGLLVVGVSPSGRGDSTSTYI